MVEACLHLQNNIFILPKVKYKRRLENMVEIFEFEGMQACLSWL